MEEDKCLVFHVEESYLGSELYHPLCFSWLHYFPFLRPDGEGLLTGKCGLCQVLGQCPTCYCFLGKCNDDRSQAVFARSRRPYIKVF